MEKVNLAVIGGSGLYQMEGLTELKEVKLKTPFGNPSDTIMIGTLAGMRIAFLPRHGRGHRIMPTELNSRANIYALKKLGVERIISVSAVGSLREDYKPLDVVIPDQLVDRTRHRIHSTFFGNGIVAHIQFSDPFCPDLSKWLIQSGQNLNKTVHPQGTWICMEGPAFSTKAESNLYRQWGMDIIGMTVLPEAKLAREAEICYAAIALVTDYDCWHQTEETVSVEMVIQNLLANVETAKNMIRNIIPMLPKERNCHCATALQYAIITDPKRITPAIRKKLALLIDKYLPEQPTKKTQSL
ncbi:MAG: S-methyl-5'-thioadenosine phosphorylase [bacterium]|nr:S-methyl-5'-thioadenosine phosphorylase [bacterium]